MWNWLDGLSRGWGGGKWIHARRRPPHRLCRKLRDRQFESLEKRTLLAVDLSAAVTASPNPVVVGQALTYSVEVENHGTTDAADVTVTDDLPAGVTFVSAAFNQHEISPVGGAITASFGNVPADTILGTLTITVIPTAANPTLSNTVSVSTSSGDSDPSNNSATATTTVNAAGTASADLSIAMSGSPVSVTVDQPFTYTATVKNNSGVNSAADTTLTDVLPPGLTFVSATASQGSISQSGDQIIGDLGSLAAGGSVTVTMTVISGTAGTINDTALVSTSSGDGDVSNNLAQVATTVNAPAAPTVDLSIAMTGSPDPVVDGQSLTYTVTVTNNSSTDSAADTIVTDPLSGGVIFVSATSSQGTTAYTPAGKVFGGTLAAELGTLAPGASATVTIVVKPEVAFPDVIPIGGGPPPTVTISNTATVSTSSGGSDPSNNTATVKTTVTEYDVAPGASRCYLPGQPGDGTDTTFISNLYHELLDRDPDAAGAAYWKSFLSQDGGADQLGNPRRSRMVGFFLASPEYRDHLVESMYEQFLHRTAEPGGLNFFAGQLAQGVDEKVVLSEIVGSQEYFVKNGDTNQGFADGLYRDVLGRAAESSGEAYWAGLAAQAGGARDAIVLDFLDATETDHDLLVDTSASALAQLTGGGWETLYLQGDLGGAHDQFFNQLQAGDSWQGVIEAVLNIDRYYDSSQSA